MAFLFNSDAARAAIFREIFARELPDLEFFHSSDAMEPDRVRYLITWTVPDEISRYRNLEVLFPSARASISSRRISCPAM
jgi:glyoxylate/hydroxypyruvate reductase A